jgi:hypothetical protein
MVEQSARHLSATERQTFLDDLVGLEMTLLTEGSNYLVSKHLAESQTFTPAQIPADFWMTPVGGNARSPEIRARFREAATERYQREAKTKNVKAAKLERKA